MSSNATRGDSPSRRKNSSSITSAKSLPTKNYCMPPSSSRPKSLTNRATSHECAKNITAQHKHDNKTCLNEVTKLFPDNTVASSRSSRKGPLNHPEAMKRYLDDRTHSNPGFSYSYTNGMICTYGFPTDTKERDELEKAIIAEAEETARRQSQERNTTEK